MRIGVFNSGWWERAVSALSHHSQIIPQANTQLNPHSLDLAARIANGQAMLRGLTEASVDLLIDNAGEGLGFVDGEGGDGLALAHEKTGRPLISHFIDPITTSFQGLPWEIAWQSLGSPTWLKAAWDRAQCIELQRFGVPNVVHLPMAAPNRVYDTSPPLESGCKPVVSFVGGQNTSYFRSNASIAANALLPGVLAQAVRSELSDVTFLESYDNIFGMGDPVNASDSVIDRGKKALQYFHAKLFYNAFQCIRQRDRFVIFLARKLGSAFELRGTGWNEAYGLQPQAPFATFDEYLNHFRRTAINLNLVNGNAETGLNMRHFEITAAGGFMLCRSHPELADCFEIGRECVAFDTEIDLLEKIRHYLDHAKERNEIAQAGQRRTLSCHLYSHRLQALLQHVNAASPSRKFSTSTWQDDCRKYVPAADVILDCGANAGQMAKGFRKTYPRATIYCFEPVRALQDELVACCKEVGAVVIPKGVGDFNGQARISLTNSREAHSLFDHLPGNPCEKWTQVVGHEEITVCTLDTWCHQTGIEMRRIDLIKLDIQGAELQALYGARRLLQHVRLILLEVSFVPIYKDAPLYSEVDAFLRESGFDQVALYPSDQPHNWGDALYHRKGSRL